MENLVQYSKSETKTIGTGEYIIVFGIKIEIMEDVECCGSSNSSKDYCDTCDEDSRC